MMRLSTQGFIAELRIRGFALSPARAQIWAARYPEIGIRFGNRWTYDPRAVDLLAHGISPEEVAVRLGAANQSGEAA